MSGRIFQNVVLQLKENTDRTVGVIDGEGVVIACSELSMIGQRWSEYVAAVNGAAGSMVCFDGKTFKALSGWGNQFDYAAFRLWRQRDQQDHLLHGHGGAERSQELLRGKA